ncbi:unnamed protein product, partial [Brachionus calyciflorus]
VCFKFVELSNLDLDLICLNSEYPINLTIQCSIKFLSNDTSIKGILDFGDGSSQIFNSSFENERTLTSFEAKFSNHILLLNTEFITDSNINSFEIIASKSGVISLHF